MSAKMQQKAHRSRRRLCPALKLRLSRASFSSWAAACNACWAAACEGATPAKCAGSASSSRQRVVIVRSEAKNAELLLAQAGKECKQEAGRRRGGGLGSGKAAAGAAAAAAAAAAGAACVGPLSAAFRHRCAGRAHGPGAGSKLRAELQGGLRAVLLALLTLRGGS